jgi:sulfur-carrier protein
MSVSVAIPGIWRGLTDGQATVASEGSTVLEVLQSLVYSHPLMHDRLFTPGGKPKGFVHVFLNKKAVADLTTAVQAGDEILLLMAIAGG